MHQAQQQPTEVKHWYDQKKSHTQKILVFIVKSSFLCFHFLPHNEENNIWFGVWLINLIWFRMKMSASALGGTAFLIKQVPGKIIPHQYEIQLLYFSISISERKKNSSHLRHQYLKYLISSFTVLLGSSFSSVSNALFTMSGGNLNSETKATGVGFNRISRVVFLLVENSKGGLLLGGHRCSTKESQTKPPVSKILTINSPNKCPDLSALTHAHTPNCETAAL